MNEIENELYPMYGGPVHKSPVLCKFYGSALKFDKMKEDERSYIMNRYICGLNSKGDQEKFLKYAKDKLAEEKIEFINIKMNTYSPYTVELIIDKKNTDNIIAAKYHFSNEIINRKMELIE